MAEGEQVYFLTSYQVEVEDLQQQQPRCLVGFNVPRMYYSIIQKYSLKLIILRGNKIF